MEIVAINCANCGKEIYVQQQYKKDEMFCTLGYVAAYREKSKECKASYREKINTEIKIRNRKKSNNTISA